MQHLNGKVVSPNWVAPIAVPGHGVYFPTVGLTHISEEAIAYLESIGHVTTLEPSDETVEEKVVAVSRKKRNIKTDSDVTLVEE
jgi:transketolase C-terminal domain/subunit